jgi:hypothetical protein
MELTCGRCFSKVAHSRIDDAPRAEFAKHLRVSRSPYRDHAHAGGHGHLYRVSPDVSGGSDDHDGVAASSLRVLEQHLPRCYGDNRGRRGLEKVKGRRLESNHAGRGDGILRLSTAELWIRDAVDFVPNLELARSELSGGYS